jgi:hypothetical protein
MDGIGFDRIAKGLAASSARRQAVRASVAGLLASALGHASQVAEARKKKRKKKKKNKGNNAPQCANVTEVCTVNTDCCNAELGVIICRDTLVKDNCATLFPGKRCCALDGVICDPQQGNCGCCDDHVCTLGADNQFRCQPAEP